MKFELLFTGIAIIGLSLLGPNDMNNGNSKTKENQNEEKYVFHMGDLSNERAESGRAYLSFLNVDSMHCGVYHLKAGAEDGQQPHDEDEVYYVEKGKGKFTYGDQQTDVAPGTVLFVPAKMEHRFHAIEEDLTLLVFFAKNNAE